MKKISLKTLSIVGITVATLWSCDSLKDLDKDYYSITPNPLEVHGGKVKFDAKGQFPEKIFKKDVALEITPELRYEGGKVDYKMVEFQGEDYPGNATVIPFEAGKTVTFSDEIDYTPEMENSELYVNLTGKKGDKTKVFDPILIAPGVITTSLLVEDDYLSSFVAPDYTQTTSNKASGVVNFLVNSSSIRSKELRDKDFKDIMSLVKEAGKNDKLTLTGINFEGYASPEGEATLNSNLSDDRAKKVEAKLMAAVKRAKIKYQDTFFTKEGKGADWDGVIEAIQNSNIEDKDMILRSLDEQPLLDSKEATLKTFSNTYKAIKNDILPELRRTQIVVSYDLVGKTDEEIKELVSKSVDELKVETTKASGEKALQIDAEEILYATTLVESDEERLDILKKGVELYPVDYRFASDAGHYAQKLNKVEDAISLFERAHEIEENDVTINNLAVSKMLANGDKEVAEDLFVKSTTAEASYNRGIKAIKEGKYDEAIDNMQGKNTFNLALAKVLNGDYDGGIKVLEAGEITTAIADYLKAIASQRLGKVEDAKKYIASAIEKDPSLEEKSKKDIEFRDINNPKEETTTQE